MDHSQRVSFGARARRFPHSPSRRSRAMGLRLATLACAAPLAQPAAALDSWNIDLVSSLPGYLDHAQVADGFVFGATGSGLLVLDVSTGRDPIQVAFLPVQGASLVAVEGPLAYITASADFGEGSLVIVDISRPSSPVEIGRCDGLFLPTDIAVRDGLAFVADSNRGLRIIDAGDPSAPVQIGFVPTSGTTGGLDLVGSIVYLADGEHGLYLIDVLDPAQPTPIAELDPGHSVRDVVVHGDYAFLATAPGIRVVDVADPVAPVEVGSFPSTLVQYVAWHDGYIHLLLDHSIRIVDVRNPLSPSPVSAIPIEGRPLHAAFSGQTAFVAGWNGGLRVLDVQDPADPREISAFDLVGDALSVQLRDKRVYLTGGYREAEEFGSRARDGLPHPGRRSEGSHAARDPSASGLYVVDLVEPSRPVVTGRCEYGNAMDLVLRDSLAYMTDWGGRLGVFTIADPGHPSEVGWAPTAYWTTDLALEGRYAYVFIEHDLLIFDLIDPARPARVGTVRTGTTALDVQGDRAYTLNYSEGLDILDVSDPAAPLQLGSLDLPNWAEGVAVEGEFAYVANGAHGLRILDVRQPSAPVEVGAHDTPGYAVGVTVDAGRAYVSDREGGVRVFDVSDPAAPKEVAYFVTTAWAEDVAVSGDDIVVGCWDGGIFVLRERSSSGAALGGAAVPSTTFAESFPNPFGGRTEIRFRVPSDQAVQLTVFSPDGRRVAGLLERRLGPGTHAVAWSGFDEQGRAVPSGLYLYRLRVGERSWTGRMTVLR